MNDIRTVAHWKAWNKPFYLHEQTNEVALPLMLNGSAILDTTPLTLNTLSQIPTISVHDANNSAGIAITFEIDVTVVRARQNRVKCRNPPS